MILPKRGLGVIPVLLAALLLPATDLSAAKIAEIADTRLVEQLVRFFSFRDPSVRYAVLASLLLGTCCGQFHCGAQTLTDG